MKLHCQCEPNCVAKIEVCRRLSKIDVAIGDGHGKSAYILISPLQSKTLRKMLVEAERKT